MHINTNAGNLHQNDGKRKSMERKGTAPDPAHSTRSGRGSVMSWACMAANETPCYCHVFKKDLTADKRSRMNVSASNPEGFLKKGCNS